MQCRIYQQHDNDPQQGSVLLIALLLLGAVVLSTVYLSLVLVNEIKSTRFSDNATVSYYAAESGIERALWRLKYSQEQNDPTLFTDLSGRKRLCAAEDGGSSSTAEDGCVRRCVVNDAMCSSDPDCPSGICVVANTRGDPERTFDYTSITFDTTLPKVTIRSLGTYRESQTQVTTQAMFPGVLAQSAYNENTGSKTSRVSMPADAIGGHLIVFAIAWESAKGLAVAYDNVSDDQENVYTLVGEQMAIRDDNRYINSRVYYAVAKSTGPLTVTSLLKQEPTGANPFHNVYLFEFSGIPATNVFDTSSVHINSPTPYGTFTSGALTSTSVNDLLFGLNIDSSSGVPDSLDNTWIVIHPVGPSTSDVMAYKNVASANHATFTGECGGSTDCTAWLLSFKLSQSFTATSTSP